MSVYTSFASIPVLEPAGGKASAALIFLHGATETGEQMKRVFQKTYGISGHSYFKFYFPTSRERYFKFRDATQTYWFNVERTGPRDEDLNGNLEDANEVTDDLERLITEIEASGIRRDRIALGGASQGGMATLYSVYNNGLQVAAVVTLASFLVFQKKKDLLKDIKTPLLSLHGEDDIYIPSYVMNQTWSVMRKHGLPFVPIKLLRRGHAMDRDYAKAMLDWLENKIPEDC